MAFWNRKKNWEDEYDNYYAQDRRWGNDGGAGGRREVLRYAAHALTLAFVGALFLGGVGIVSGQTMVEKMVTELALPLGLVWLLLMIMVYFCLLARQAWPALVGLGCWIILTLAGNGYLSNWLITTLEAPYQNIDVFKIEPLETLVVLGGGTSTRVTGQSQLERCGDRVALAARMYHAGRVKKLICTGSDSFRTSANDKHPREEAAEILLELGVPAENILQLEGKNTSIEMRNLKLLVDQQPALGRMGVMTSAWHLNRTLRLSRANGLELIPVPANFRSQPFGPSPNIVVPGAIPLDLTALALKEYLAYWVSR